VTVPVSGFNKNRYKSASYEFSDFFVSCNLHEWLLGVLHFAGEEEGDKGKIERC
jgi:hypothetical protein